METITTPSLIERFNSWLKESVTIKLLSIGFLVLILLIPTAWIESLINERQYRAESVVKEISDKWSGEQTVSGPVLVVPFTKREKIDKGKDGIEIREWTETAFFLPEQFKANAKVKSETRYRGIFEAVVYESDIDIQSKFQQPDFGKLNIQASDVKWKEAQLVFGISDLRGISKNPIVKIGGIEKSSEPSNNIGLSTLHNGSSHEDNDQISAADYTNRASENGVVVPLLLNSAEDFKGDVSVSLSLKGSSLLYFVPVGKTTEVKIDGQWKDPSFTGSFLPTNPSVTESGFVAQWNILHYNRPFSQQWIGTGQQLKGSEFGVKLLMPVGQYQKSIRTAKYGVLVILLTFVALFLVEIVRKVRIHPFQYILIGAALIIYYTLLLSFSEHVGYNLAYLLATISTVTLVSLYSITFLQERKMIFVFSGFLSFFYAFIFVIIQLQDYSLLLGSVGLFVIVATIMYFSKNIKWYKEDLKPGISE